MPLLLPSKCRLVFADAVTCAVGSGRGLNAALLACGMLLLFAVCAKPLEQIHPSVTQAFPPVDPRAHKLSQEYHLASGYGLFRRMTGVGPKGEVARPEVIIEGSADGARLPTAYPQPCISSCVWF